MTVSIFSSYNTLLNKRDPYQQVGLDAHKEQNSVTNTNFLLAKMLIPLNLVSHGQKKLLAAWFLVSFSRVQVAGVGQNSIYIVYFFVESFILSKSLRQQLHKHLIVEQSNNRIEHLRQHKEETAFGL